ncbi:SRPBCC family protein [Actinophytocola sp.]|uniref:SRPBCC family protein n=1 Tax=Actinophytocola sp. TaxID=1872138 RepID=UPI002EDB94AA
MTTTERTRNDQDADRLTRGLGWLSVGLGTAQVLRPSDMDRVVGVKDNPRNRTLMATVGGMRELTVGTAILSRRRPTPWLWARVAGDVLDLAMLGRALLDPRNGRKRVALAMASVAGVTAADILASVRQSRDAATSTTITVKSAVTVRWPVEDVYRFWRDLTNLPRFMAHLESVRVDGRRSHWKAKAPAGTTVEWDAEIVADVESEHIAWRSVEGADVPNSGSVHFATAPGDRGTEVVVELAYAPPLGRAGVAVAKLFGEEPAQQVKDDLRRFKQVMETGEVVRSDANPTGVLSYRQLAQRPAQPIPDERSRAHSA